MSVSNNKTNIMNHTHGATRSLSHVISSAILCALALLIVLAPARALAADGTITGVSPSTVHTSGGDTITLSGTNFGSIAQVASNFQHSLVVTESGTVYAWGSGAQGKLGNGDTADSSVPVAVDASGVMSGKTIVGIAAGAHHSLALASDGTVFAWGDNVFGQLGDGSGVDSSVPVVVAVVDDIVQVAASAWTSYALAADGTIYSWGLGDVGQLGNNTTSNSLSPVEATTSGVGAELDGKQVIQIAGATGDDFVSVLTSEGTVHSWGANSAGQRGTGVVGGSQLVPSAAAGGAIAGKQITQIATGAYHVVALDDEGKVYAWGDNERGQLGEGTQTDSPTPLEMLTGGVIDGKVIASVAASGFASYAVTDEGTLYSGGYNLDGQLARDTSPFSEVSVLGAAPVENVVQVSGGLSYALAYTSDGHVIAWGANGSGQLGDGTTIGQETPITVNGLLAPLYNAPTVLVGGVAATNVVLLSDGQITFTAPAHAVGTYDVVVTLADGRTAQLLGSLTYSGDAVPAPVPAPAPDVIPTPPSAGFALAEAKWALVVLACFVFAGVLVVLARRPKRD